VICANCKTELDPALRLCSHCGAEIVPASEPEWRAQIRETVRRRREERQRRLARQKEDTRQLSIFAEASQAEAAHPPEEEDARARRAAIRARVEEKSAKLSHRGRRTRPLVDAGEVAIGTRGGALAAATELEPDPLVLSEEPAEVEALDLGSLPLRGGGEEDVAEREQLDPAFPGERILAALVDFGFIATLLLGLAYLTTNIVGQPLRNLPGSSLAALGCLGFFIAAGYLIFFWGLSGQTLGGLLTRVRVVAPGGLPPGMGRAAVRVLGCLLSLALVGVGFLGWWTDRERRGWPDRLASTLVVRG
jgi:uncharacterized RDD family membrane protein YckC